jgi:hypothetical protein
MHRRLDGVGCAGDGIHAEPHSREDERVGHLFLPGPHQVRQPVGAVHRVQRGRAEREIPIGGGTEATFQRGPCFDIALPGKRERRERTLAGHGDLHRRHPDDVAVELDGCAIWRRRYPDLLWRRGPPAAPVDRRGTSMRHEEHDDQQRTSATRVRYSHFIPSCVTFHPAPASGLRPVPADTAKASISAATVLSRSLHGHPEAPGPAKS